MAAPAKRTIREFESHPGLQIYHKACKPGTVRQAQFKEAVDHYLAPCDQKESWSTV
jgi:hypothetical protein